MEKIAYLVRPAEGGMKTHLLGLLSGLDRIRYEPVVICPPGTPLAREVQNTGVQMVPLEIVDGLNPLKDISAAMKLKGILKQLQPDILHIHGAKAGHVGRMFLGGKRRPKVVLTYHSFIFDERTSGMKRNMISMQERRYQRITDRIIAVSQALKNELTTVMKLNGANIEVIYNGIEFVEVPPTPHNDIRIGVIARLAPQKGIEYFIRAAALVMMKYPQTSYYIIGDGPQKAMLTRLVQALDIHEGVYFLNYKSDIPAQLSKFDILVHPSTRESFGMTIVEALSQRLPVIASRVGGIPEIIQDGKTGILVEPANPTAIADKIMLLLEDREYAHHLGQSGCADVRERFSIARMVEATQAVYAEVTAPNARRRSRT